MSREITREERRANMARWKFQHRLMADKGFNAAFYTAKGGKPRAYEHYSGNWRISTCVGGKWKLERWTGRWYYPRSVRGARGLKIWSPLTTRFDTPLAVALWFNLMRNVWGET